MKKTNIGNSRILKILFFSLLAAVIAVSIMLFFLNVGSGKPDDKVRIGYLEAGSTFSFFVALENGFFEKHGVEVEAIKFQNTNQMMDALLSGSIDGTSPGGIEAMLAAEQASPGKFRIFEMAAAEKDTKVHKFIVRKDSDINSLYDLEGRTLGILPGTTMIVTTTLILQNYVDVSKVKMVSMATPLQVQALASGQVDAIFALEPVGTIAESQGISRTIAVNSLYNDVLQPFPTVASAFSTKFASENPGLVERYVSAMEDAHELIENDENAAKKSLVKYLRVSPELTDDIGVYSYWGKDEIDMNAFRRLIALFINNGILDTAINSEELILE